jgi:hypothetical protein
LPFFSNSIISMPKFRRMFALEWRSALGRLRYGNNTSWFAFALRPPHIHTHCYGPFSVFESTKMFLEPREYIRWHNTHFLPPCCCLGHTLRTYILFCAPTLLLFGAFCVFRNRTHKFMKPGLKPCWIYIRNGWYYRWMFKMHLKLRFSSGNLYQIFPFVRQFYAHPSPLYFSEAFKHQDLTIISSKSGTWQGDLLGRVLFALTRFPTFCPTVVAHLTCVFLSLVDDIHIIGLALDVLFDFLQL